MDTKNNKSIVDIFIDKYHEIEKSISLLEKLIQLTNDKKQEQEYYQELVEEKRKLEDFKQGVISLAKTFS